MRTVPSLPWWGWALVAFFVLNVVLRMDVGVFLPLLIGLGAAAMLGKRRTPVRRGPGGPGPLPPPEHNPGPSPWSAGEPSAGRGTAGTDPSMPRIEVPQYPQGAGATAAYPPPAVNPSTDPVISLGQLHLSRGSRDLHAAASTGSAADVARVLREVGEQSERLLTQLGGAGAMPGSGRREFEAGLRRLQRDVAAARGEDPPGAKVARVVRTAATLGQTGRHE